MGITFTNFFGGSSKSNNFVINIGTSGNNVFDLDKTYDEGSYSISTASGNNSFDIYAVSASGEYAGYTSTSVLDASKKFNRLVILGLSNNDQASFEYRGKNTFPVEAGSETSAGAYISSVSISSLENIDDTTIITGGNFANDVEVYFIGQSSQETLAKSVAVVSTNQLIVTRPDSFDVDDSPYTIKVVNPGIPTPNGSNLFKLNNSVTAGTDPVWQTSASQVYNLGVLNTINLAASDNENSNINYTIISGSLPDGLTMNSDTGVISGTPSGETEGEQSVFTVRATDAGGNFVDRQFIFTANVAPIWVTTSFDIGDSGEIFSSQPISFQFVANSGVVGGQLSYSLESGSLPSGTDLSSSGLLTGTPNAIETSTFRIRATDEAGLFASREFAINVIPESFSVEYLVIAGGAGGGRYGGGGAGGYINDTRTLSTSTNYSISIGAGGAGDGDEISVPGQNGSNTTALGETAIGGGGGGSYQSASAPGQDGGSGGGGQSENNGSNDIAGGQALQPTSGSGGFGNNGGSGYRNTSDVQGINGGGGGGANAPGVDAALSLGGDGGAGKTSAISGSSTFYAAGGGGATWVGTPGSGGSNIGGDGGRNNEGAGVIAATSGVANTGSGGGAAGNAPAGNGGSGIVILSYPSRFSITLSAGLSGTTTTVGANKVTSITSGTGTVSW